MSSSPQVCLAPEQKDMLDLAGCLQSAAKTTARLLRTGVVKRALDVALLLVGSRQGAQGAGKGGSWKGWQHTADQVSCCW